MKHGLKIILRMMRIKIMLALCMLFLIMLTYKAVHIEKAETVFYEDEWYEYPADELIERYL